MAVAVLALSWVVISTEARGSPFGLFAFPQTRRGRATASLRKTNDDNLRKLGAKDDASSILDSITISKDATEDDDIIQKLVDSLMKVSNFTSSSPCTFSVQWHTIH